MTLNVVFALGFVVVTAATAAAQDPARGGQRAGGPSAPMKNLQVLPKDMPQPQCASSASAT